MSFEIVRFPEWETPHIPTCNCESVYCCPDSECENQVEVQVRIYSVLTSLCINCAAKSEETVSFRERMYRKAVSMINRF